jgi:hypothetical protein
MEVSNTVLQVSKHPLHRPRRRSKVATTAAQRKVVESWQWSGYILVRSKFVKQGTEFHLERITQLMEIRDGEEDRLLKTTIQTRTIIVNTKGKTVSQTGDIEILDHTEPELKPESETKPRRRRKA